MTYFHTGQQWTGAGLIVRDEKAPYSTIATIVAGDGTEQGTPHKAAALIRQAPQLARALDNIARLAADTRHGQQDAGLAALATIESVATALLEKLPEE